MRKIICILIIGTFLTLFQNCSYDDEILEESTELFKEFNTKMGNNTNKMGPIIEGCEIEYTFSDPNLTPSEKAAIRYSYSFFLGLKSVNGNTEIWYTDCSDFNNYNDLNPGCDVSGCYTIQSCPRDGCGSSGPKPKDPIEDPLGSDQ
ncbi:hypothetical protein D1818_09020 [Aquimarina sp. BL5]|uniref:hypothetical protein n=1 Tax=Aquimarina sp. BL5 TaxID=1714860 RepID=UPI000E4D14B9|nr:hypothetical protein [Aquimarina sp. BL5]AXT50959.1 hypothetical protein D1818_09020 [Aquimarina sp. BL5]RKN03545.1 hypothetical protein D7036_13625 [Aquimarina sp. BL5]